MDTDLKGVLLSKNGELSIVTIPSSSNTYYKVCGFKKAGGFCKLHKYEVGRRRVEIWGRDEGSERMISKWELPPPLDNKFAYGSQLAVITDSKGNIQSIDKTEWQRLYEKMFGGFHELGDDDSELSSDELAEYDDEELTKEGYLKDGFVVSGSDSEEVGEEEYEA